MLGSQGSAVGQAEDSGYLTGKSHTWERLRKQKHADAGILEITFSFVLFCALHIFYGKHNFSQKNPSFIKFW